jgi:hypothetical protein
VSGGVAIVLALVTALTIAAAAVVARRNRALRQRPGDVSVLARTRWGGRWMPGHGVWVDDVFAFRRSPAGWNETLLWVTYAPTRSATDEERAQLRRLGDDPLVVTFVLASGGSMTFAAKASDRARLLGPYAEPARPSVAVSAR